MEVILLLAPKKAEAPTAVQEVLKFPELKAVKISETRWLSHEHAFTQFAKNFQF